MQNQFVHYKNSGINYCRYGNGNQLVLCFHGYGEEAGSFSFLEKYAGNQFTFIAIDLPFHGQTEWKESLNFSVEDLKRIIKEILLQNNIKHQASNLELLGFSLGGRIALSLYQSQPQIIKKMVLLAPDGLKVNFWYWLGTKTLLGNKLFAFTMKKPHWFFGFLKLMNKVKLVNSSIFKFVNYYIGDEKARRSLYERWTGFRKLTPDLKKIKSQIQANKTQVRFIYGRYDKVILPARGEKFQKGIEEYCELKIIESGHQVLHEKHAEEIMLALLK